MEALSAPDYWLTRLVVQRGLAAVYCVAFVAAINQFRPLLGSNGLVPVPAYLRRVPFRRSPTLFHAHYSDGLALAVGWAGFGVSIAAILGLPEAVSTPVSMLAWLLLWVLYLSIANVGQTFYSFGWETLLLEAGFLAIFLGGSGTAPPLLVIWLLRWLVFRVEFGAGLIKIRGDPCWRSLTCLFYHHETQPMPNPVSWYVHHLPRWFHRTEVAGNHVAQLVAPWVLLLAPHPIRDLAGLVIIATQLWLILTGNFSWLNWLTVVLASSAFAGSWLHAVIPVSPPVRLPPAPTWHLVLVLGLTALVVVLSRRPVLNIASRRQLMNASFDPLHLVNTYGAFGSVTRVRHEIVIEGTREQEITPMATWTAYEFRGKPGDPRRRPPQVAPYHLRLDWLMWFAALEPSYARPWFVPLIGKLLGGDAATLRLLGRNPFPESPPAHIRARLYRYRFSTPEERRTTGAWWVRTLVGEYMPPVGAQPGNG